MDHQLQYAVDGGNFKFCHSAGFNGALQFVSLSHELPDPYMIGVPFYGLIACVYKDDLEYVHLGVTSSPLKVYISLGAFQNSDPCRGQSNLVLFVFVLKRGGRGEKRKEGKIGEGGEGGEGGGRRGVSQHNLKMVETQIKR